MTNYDKAKMAADQDVNKINLQEKVIALVDRAGQAACDKVLQGHGIEMVAHRVQSTMVGILLGNGSVDNNLRVEIALDLALEVGK